MYLKDSVVLEKLFSNSAVIRCGQLCYGLYLLHQPIGVLISEKVIGTKSFFIFGSYLPSTFINIFLSLVVSFVAAQLSYSFFEAHFLKLKKYFV